MRIKVDPDANGTADVADTNVVVTNIATLVVTVATIAGASPAMTVGSNAYASAAGDLAIMAQSVINIPLEDADIGGTDIGDTIAAGSTTTYSIKGDTSGSAADSTLQLTVPNTTTYDFRWLDDNETVNIETTLINSFPVTGGSFKY